MDARVLAGAQPDRNFSTVADVTAVNADVTLPGFRIGGDPESRS